MLKKLFSHGEIAAAQAVDAMKLHRTWLFRRGQCKHGFLFGYTNEYDDDGNYLGSRPAKCSKCEEENANADG
jgi:hypothetical protein